MRLIAMTMLLLCIAGTSIAQGVLSEVMSGALINPEVGVYAWYTLKDIATDTRLFMRQAIVGKKEVEGKTGYYLETEIIPEIGFSIIYKLLLTGPATVPGNVHEIIVKEGVSPVETLPVTLLSSEETKSADSQRESLGMETVKMESGEIQAEHFRITEGDHITDVWINDDIRPMGIVKMVSPEGELLLNRNGKGGVDAESALNRLPQQEEGADVKVRVSPGPNKNFSGKGASE